MTATSICVWARAGPVAGDGWHDGPRWLLYRDVRKFGASGLYRRKSRARSSAPTTSASCSATTGPSRSTTAFTLRAFRRLTAPSPGPPQVDPARPGVPGRRRQHLRRRGALAGAAASAALASTLRPPDERRALRRHPGRPRARPSSGAARRSTTTPRPRATARCRSTSTSTSAPGCPAIVAAGRSGGSCSAQRGTHFCSWCQRLPAATAGHERQAGGQRAAQHRGAARPQLVGARRTCADRLSAARAH